MVFQTKFLFKLKSNLKSSANGDILGANSKKSGLSKSNSNLKTSANFMAIFSKLKRWANCDILGFLTRRCVLEIESEEGGGLSTAVLKIR